MMNRSAYFQYFFKFLLTIFLFLFITIFSIKITLNFKPLYYFDIKYLSIEKYTDLNKEEIKSTYNYLIYYINTSKPIQFKIPLLPSSKEAIVHFEEVKNLFRKLDTVFFISSVFIAIGIYFMNRYRDFSPLKWCSTILLLACLSAFATFFINFGKAFDTFHEILFNNNYWLFSPKTDPVINILPEEFFLHCSAFIIFSILFWSVILRIIYKKVSHSVNSA